MPNELDVVNIAETAKNKGAH